MRISDWSSDVCASDLVEHVADEAHAALIAQFGGGEVAEAAAAVDAAMHRDHGVLDGLRPLLIARSVDTPLHARGELARAEIGLDDGGLGHYRTAARLPKREASSGESPRVSAGSSWPSTLRAARIRSEEHTYELQSLMPITY